MTNSKLPTDMFPERLKAARDLRGWSQNDLALRCGMPQSSVGHFEGGTRKPSFDTLSRLANALEVTADYLLGRVDDPGRAEADGGAKRHFKLPRRQANRRHGFSLKIKTILIRFNNQDA